MPRKSGKGQLPHHTQSRGFGAEPKGKVRPKRTSAEPYGAPDVANITPNNRVTKLDADQRSRTPDMGLNVGPQNAKRGQLHTPGHPKSKGKNSHSFPTRNTKTGLGSGSGKSGVRHMSSGVQWKKK